MDTSIITQYKNAQNLTYQNIEVYHFNALKKICGDILLLSEINILVSIHYLTKREENIPSNISSMLGIANNNLSARLKELENDQYITRKTDEKDHRYKHLLLTDKGEMIIKKVNTYFKSFSVKLKSFNLFELTTLLNVMNKLLSTISSDHKTITIKQALESSDALQNSLFNIYFFIRKHEEMMIDKLPILLSLSDWYILSELYLNENNEDFSIKSLSESIYMPYQTLATKINAFISKKLIEKSENTNERRKFIITIKDEVKPIVEFYMMQRILLFYQLTHDLTLKERNILFKTFKLVKEHALTIL